MRVEDLETRRPAREALAETYGLPRFGAEDDGSTWLFRVEPRAACG